MENILRNGSLTVDLRTGSVQQAGRPVYLSHMEYQLLLMLLTQVGLRVSTQEIIDQLYSGFGDPRSIWVLMSRLRMKIHPVQIRTSRRGYIMQPADCKNVSVETGGNHGRDDTTIRD